MNKEIIEKLRELKPILKERYGIEEFAVFGSVARDTMTFDSDVDIMVEFSSPIGFRFNRLVEYLENLLGHKVDVLTKDDLQALTGGKITNDKGTYKYDEYLTLSGAKVNWQTDDDQSADPAWYLKFPTSTKAYQYKLAFPTHRN